MSFLINKMLISIILNSLFLIVHEPLLSHGSNGDCSEECTTYYCPDSSKHSDQIKEKEYK